MREQERRNDHELSTWHRKLKVLALGKRTVERRSNDQMLEEGVGSADPGKHAGGWSLQFSWDIAFRSVDLFSDVRGTSFLSSNVPRSAAT